MNLINARAFDEQGGLTIGIGAKNCLYTLRSESNEQAAVHVGDGLPPQVRTLRRSFHIRNLGKDWAEVAARLPEILRESGYAEDVCVFVPGHAEGKLDPNKTPDAKFIPTEIIPFGQYEGSTIPEIHAKDPDYLYFLAENYNPAEERARGRWMAFLRSELAPELAERKRMRDEAKADRDRVMATNKERFAQLATCLRGQSRHDGDFCASMAKHFEEGHALDELSPNAAGIVTEIWGKTTGGRRGSKAYNAALDRFEELFEEANLVPEEREVAALCTQLTTRTHGQTARR